jgi:pseudaminic acid cytidylyltransferase
MRFSRKIRARKHDQLPFQAPSSVPTFPRAVVSMNVAIIPARGGSKRIPRKNVREFAGKPMILWSIAAAQDSGCFARIIVSTDDPEIADTARAAGAEAPFERPAELSNDHTATLPVIAHAVEWLRAAGTRLERVCCLYATAPLVTAADLARGASLLDDPGVDYVFTCSTFAFPVQRALIRSVGGGVEPLFPEHIAKRSQDLPEAIHDAGQFYWGSAAAFAAQRPIFGPRSRPLMIPRYRVQDIDTLEDWTRAELLFKALKETTN